MKAFVERLRCGLNKEYKLKDILVWTAFGYLVCDLFWYLLRYLMK